MSHWQVIYEVSVISHVIIHVDAVITEWPRGIITCQLMIVYRYRIYPIKYAHCFGLPWLLYVDGLVQDCSISNALAMEIRQFCTKPSMCDSYAILNPMGELWGVLGEYFGKNLCVITGTAVINFLDTGIEFSFKKSYHIEFIWNRA